LEKYENQNIPDVYKNIEPPNFIDSTVELCNIHGDGKQQEPKNYTGDKPAILNQENNYSQH
jgi:hypothetical protein